MRRDIPGTHRWTTSLAPGKINCPLLPPWDGTWSQHHTEVFAFPPTLRHR